MNELLSACIAFIHSSTDTIRVYSYQLAVASEFKNLGYVVESEQIKSWSPETSYELAEWLSVCFE